MHRMNPQRRREVWHRVRPGVETLEERLVLNFSPAAPVPYTVPTLVATADFNGDGHADLAIANVKDDAVSIRLGTGAGDFVSVPEVPVAAGPQSIAVADFNRDGRLDLAVANAFGNNVAVLLNRFPTRLPPRPTPPPHPLPIALPIVPQPVAPQPAAARALVVELVPVKRKGKPPRLQVMVRYADTGAVKTQFLSPFQRSAYRQIKASVLDTNADGVSDVVQLTARRVGPNKKLLTRTFAV